MYSLHPAVRNARKPRKTRNGNHSTDEHTLTLPRLILNHQPLFYQHGYTTLFYFSSSLPSVSQRGTFNHGPTTRTAEPGDRYGRTGTGTGTMDTGDTEVEKVCRRELRRLRGNGRVRSWVTRVCCFTSGVGSRRLPIMRESVLENLTVSDADPALAFRKTRCEGLSLSLFFFSISGSELRSPPNRGWQADLA